MLDRTGGEPTVDDVLAKIKSLARNDVGERVAGLKERAEVVREGLPPQAAKEAAAVDGRGG